MLLLLKQNAAKAFCSIRLDDTVLESLNATTFTDNGTGDITHTFVSAMSSKNHITTAFNVTQEYWWDSLVWWIW